MQHFPVAAAVSVAPVLRGPRRLVAVAAVTDRAVYLDTGDPDCPAICLVTSSAVRVPCALVLGDCAPPPDVTVGDTGLVGGGQLVLGGAAYRPARWWRPARPARTVGAVPAAHLPPLDAGTSGAVARLARDLASDAPLAGPVTALLGRGPGLTPLGDDVLAGALVALVAADSPAGARLAAETIQRAPHRTTFVSAALLWHAARGECVPELAALIAGAPGATEALLRVGHTSGAGLAHGVCAAQPPLHEVSVSARNAAKRSPAVANEGRTVSARNAAKRSPAVANEGRTV
ncbi:DUF2877 domain-containing protein [Micromonospora sp. WMMD558]|uniref:oxamate carbamoyltransferase subunit AllH family protein n=1 Tax=unclassified Micromonospora TaxID=2617518 RepID=UPI0018B01023|nr:DUF2877 domain-containing protein [Micromonospora sp. WMMC415]